MGGIAGKLNFDPHVPVCRDTLARMADALSHRGSRDCRHYHGEGIALIGRSHEGGDPPSGQALGTDHFGAVRVVADADLSNAAAIRHELGRAGHACTGTGDAELIAHAYLQWGDACFERFEGPFACAVWHAPERRLLLARDRIGMRPLYFSLLHGHAVAFASEVRALLQDHSIARQWNPEAIDAYLTLGYVPAPLTMFRAITKIEPAHVVTVVGRRLALRQYWDFPFAADERVADEDARQVLTDALTRAALDRRTPGTGALVSGGTASTALAAAIGGAGTKMPALTVGIEHDASYVVRAAMASERLGTRAEVDLARPDAGAVARVLAARFDEPFGDPAAVAQYTVFTAACPLMDVALTGHGAASLWAGYARHRVEHLEASVRMWLGRSAALGGELARALPASMRSARALSRLALSPAGACASKHADGLFEESWRHGVYTRSFSWQVRGADPFLRHVDLYLRAPGEDPLARALYVDARTYLPDNILTIADRTSAAAGLRLRYPFLTPGLVALAGAMPSRLKLRGNAGMYALRQVLSPRLPAALMPPASRRTVQRPWLEEALIEWVPRALLHERFDGRGIFSRPALKRLWDEHLIGVRDHSRRLWSVLMLEFWFREFIDGDAAEQPLEYAVLRAA